MLVPPELREEGALTLQPHSSGERIRHRETVRLTKAGKRVVVSLSISPIRDSTGEIVGASEIARDITERQNAERALRESELRFRLMANTAPVFLWMAGPEKLRTYFNKPWTDFTGRPLSEEIGHGWEQGIHPDDREKSLSQYSQAIEAREPFKLEYRLHRFDGEFRWILDTGVPRNDAEGNFLGFIGSCVDISDEKEKEARLRDLSGRLIAAQEEERTRIARELHDDLSQRMALLLIGLDQLKQQLPQAEPRKRLGALAQMADEISAEIHSLSHQLHPAKLESLGLVAAVGSHCREVSSLYGLQVQFRHYGVPDHLPKDVTLCLYRVLQESLRNVVKHSGLKKATVELKGYPSELCLSVTDEGAGFPSTPAKWRGGLGLISMEERLRLVNGSLSVESAPFEGTRIEARIPVAGCGGRVEDEPREIAVGA
jgi:PAS domain S-box-containing protein